MPEWLNWLMLLVGQTSFLLGALAFRTDDILKLRKLQVYSGLLGIVFNMYLAMSSAQIAYGLWSVVVWLGIFTSINFRQALKLNNSRYELDLPADEKAMFYTTFPLIRTADVAKLLELGKILTLENNDVLIERGGHTHSLYMVVEGGLKELLPNGEKWHLGVGCLLGDVTFLIHDSKDGSRGQIISAGNTQVVKWDYAGLRSLCKSSETLEKALTDGIARGFAKKRSFLGISSNEGALITLEEPQLSVVELDTHAEVFPYLKPSGFSLLLSKAQKLSLKKDELYTIDEGFACVITGMISVTCANGETLELGKHDLVGEFGFIAPDRDNRSVEGIRAIEESILLVWAPQSLEEIQLTAPQVYIQFLRSLSRKLVFKITSRTRIA